MFDTRRLPTFCEVARRGSFAAFHGTHYAKAQNLALDAHPRAAPR